MRTFEEYLNEKMVTIHTTTINLKTGGAGNYGIRVIFEVKHWRNAVWLNIIAANAGEIPAYANKHYKIDDKTKVADIYKWAKAVSKEAIPRSREFNDMFQRILDFHDPLNESLFQNFKKAMKRFHAARNVSGEHFDEILRQAEFHANAGEQTQEKKKLKKFIKSLKSIDISSYAGRVKVANLEKRFLPLLKSMHIESKEENHENI